MSQDYSILDLFEIEDQNLEVENIKTKKKNGETTKIIEARLSYPVQRCVNCGHLTVVKNGFRKTMAQLSSMNGIRYEMEIKKQRYLCHSCNTTFGAITDLAKENQTLTRALKNQIMLLTREGLPGKLIARIYHCSPSSVRRTIIERVQPH